MASTPWMVAALVIVSLAIAVIVVGVKAKALYLDTLELAPGEILVAQDEGVAVHVHLPARKRTEYVYKPKILVTSRRVLIGSKVLLQERHLIRYVIYRQGPPVEGDLQAGVLKQHRTLLLKQLRETSEGVIFDVETDPSDVSIVSRVEMISKQPSIYKRFAAP